MKYTYFAAKLTSILLHPLLMPTYIYGFLAIYAPTVLHPITKSQHLSFLLVVFVSTALVPALSTLFMFGLKLIKSIELDDPSERILPMGFTGLFYLALTWLLYDRLQMQGLAVWLLLGISIAIFISVAFTFFFKISAHAVGAAGTCSFILLMALRYQDSSMITPMMLSTVMAGFVLSARLYLGAHNTSQIFLGALLGISVSLLLVFV